MLSKARFRSQRLTARLLLLAFVSLPTIGFAEDQPPSHDRGLRTILDESSYWRFHVTMRKPTVPTAALKAAGKEATEPAVLPVKVPYRHYPRIEHMETLPPPAGWLASDFDDADWPRARAGANWPGSVAQVAFAPAVRFSAGVLCLRGKFAVDDPTAVQNLTLSMRYRGGVVVYLNGREITRKDLPEGQLEPSTPGSDYPDEAFVDVDGKPLPGSWHAGKRIRAGDTDLPKRLATRNRSLGPVSVPADALCKGTNVLAIELHRSDYHPVALSWFNNQNVSKDMGWVPMGMAEVRLAAEGPGVTANVSRPQGFQVWNHDINDRVTVFDHGDANERIRPVALIGARNGAFSGKVVIGSTGPIRGLKATVGDFRAVDGNGSIPAAQVQIRFPRLDGHGYQRPPWFDGILDVPPVEVPVHPTSGDRPFERGGAALQPVLVTAHVPRDAAAGEYQAMLTLSADGTEPVAVPIHLSVADWELPDPRDFRTYVGVYQSPTSLALQYDVEEWSEEHWKLVETSFALLEQLSNRIVNIPLSTRTQFGNDDGMIYWVKQADGSFEYDFTVFDRYIDLVKKHFGAPDFVALHLWHAGGWSSRGASQQNTVTMVDGRSGRRERIQVPTFGTEESKAFWKPVLDEIRKRLAAAGMEQAMCLGILSDGTAEPEVFAAFDEIVPGTARWTRGCHSVTRAHEPYTLKGGGVVVCHEYCYGMVMADPDEGLPSVWQQRTWPGVAFIRHNSDHNLSLLKYRSMAERALYCGTRGVGRIGLDFWPVIQDDRGRTANIYNRWPHSSCAQREPNMFALAAPGPNGAIPTVRFEQFRQGVQDSEAMIYVAESVGEHAEELGPELAARCRRILKERIRFCVRRCSEPYQRVCFRSYHHGWRELTADLYQAASEAHKRRSTNHP